MSCVVGILHNNKVWIGAESRYSTEDGDIRPNKLKKIFRNGKYLIGFIGSVRAGQILMPHYFKPPTNIYDLPDAIKDLFTEKGCLELTSTQTAGSTCNFIIGVKGALYEILSDFQLNEIPEYSAIGSGANFAYGSLHTTGLLTKTCVMDPEERIRLALKASCEHCSSCAPPYFIESI